MLIPQPAGSCPGPRSNTAWIQTSPLLTADRNTQALWKDQDGKDRDAGEETQARLEAWAVRCTDRDVDWASSVRGLTARLGIFATSAGGSNHLK